jgi:enolase
MIKLNGTENNGKIRANENAILGVSLAVANASAATKDVPLYQQFPDMMHSKHLLLSVSSFNVINGGSQRATSWRFSSLLLADRCGVVLLGSDMVKSKCGQDATNVGDEGGFASNIQGHDAY